MGEGGAGVEKEEEEAAVKREEGELAARVCERWMGRGLCR